MLAFPISHRQRRTKYWQRFSSWRASRRVASSAPAIRPTVVLLPARPHAYNSLSWYFFAQLPMLTSQFFPFKTCPLKHFSRLSPEQYSKHFSWYLDRFWHCSEARHFNAMCPQCAWISSYRFLLVDAFQLACGFQVVDRSLIMLD